MSSSSPTPPSPAGPARPGVERPADRHRAAPRIELRDCVLRPYVPSDVEGLVRHANDPRIAANLRDRFPSPYTRADAERWIAEVADVVPPRNLAIEVAGEAAGGIGLILGEDVFRRSAEVGYWLGVAHHGRGIATRTVRAFVDYAFATFDLCRLQAGVYEWNPASARVLEKAGFVLECRQRRSVTKGGRTGDRFVYVLIREKDETDAARSAVDRPLGSGPPRP